MKKSFRLATLFNIPIEINYTWFIVLGLIIFTLARGYFPYTNPELDPASHWLMALIAALLLFASLLAHEFSHSLVAIHNNLPINGITLFIFGGVAHMEKEPSSPAVEFKMAIAGPLMSFFLSLLFFGLTQVFYILRFPSFVLSITNYLFMLNLVVGIFNLIPGFPLDGGRVLRATLWHFYKDIRKATAIASGFGKGFAFLLMGLGFLNLFTGALIAGIWFIFIGLFLREAAESSYRQVAIKKFLGKVTIASLITKDVISVPANTTLDQLIDNYFFKFRHHSFPVVEDDQILGLLTLHLVKEVDRSKWAKTTAREAMLPLNNSLVISEYAEAIEALPKMARNKVGRLLVIEGDKLVGILSQRDIMQLFEFKSEIEG
ncbi:MAG: site-2 protease family protein [Candidatus Margulisbacteria bacterium]|nr:site-2 protease family protein [Candidatus Margulisiibacteriota bacterium]